jgi:hypothetical protein
MNLKSLVYCVCLACIQANTSWALEQPRLVETVFEDFSAAFAGTEIAIPFFDEVDTNADGYPDTSSSFVSIYARRARMSST